MAEMSCKGRRQEVDGGGHTVSSDFGSLPAGSDSDEEDDVEDLSNDQAVLVEEERHVLDECSKWKLLRHLKTEIYCTLQASKVDGVGPVAFRHIPKGVDPFKTNGPPSGRVIHLTRQEVETLPHKVQDIIQRYFLPHKNEYPIPEAGLNSLDHSYYVNSSKLARGHSAGSGGSSSRNHVVANMELGVRRDERGLTELLTSRDIEVDEELLWPYAFTGRGETCLGHDGKAAPLPEDVVSNNECRVCLTSMQHGACDVVDTRCKCFTNGTSRMHLSCAKKWYTSRIQILLTQDTAEDGDAAGVVQDRWIADTAASCEVCGHKVSADFARTVMKSVDSKAIQKLHDHILKEEPISLKFSKVPGYTMQMRGGGGKEKGSGGDRREVLVRERTSYHHAGRRRVPRVSDPDGIPPRRKLERLSCNLNERTLVQMPAVHTDGIPLPVRSHWRAYCPGVFSHSKAKFWVADEGSIKPHTLPSGKGKLV